jgi:DNA-directed RNA polymerase specialized sigma24 family protein
MPSKSAFKIKVGLNIEGDWQEQPLDFLRELTKCTQGLVEQTQRKAVALARAQGSTWDEIGTALGVSRQAAWGRFAGED